MMLREISRENKMILKTLKLRIEHLNLVTNCYVVMDEETKEAMVIDPGAESHGFSSLIKVDFPCPGYIIVLSGKTRILLIIESIISSKLPVGKSVQVAIY